MRGKPSELVILKKYVRNSDGKVFWDEWAHVRSVKDGRKMLKDPRTYGLYAGDYKLVRISYTDISKPKRKR
jgi:hypothetical protein